MELLDAGQSPNAVARILGVSRWAVADWRRNGVEPRRGSEGLGLCGVCAGSPPDGEEYAALFGYYLGDGCVSRLGRTFSLRVSCDESYPGIVDDVSTLIVRVRGRGPVSRTPAPGCVVVQAYWNHWPCLFPQHGPGRKHQRTLVMEPWQRAAVTTHPGPFLRGLFHSDGCRVTNRVTTHGGDPRTEYTYGRWQFANHSEDIRRWCSESLDLLDVPWRKSNWKTISVSRREAVARLDELIGPKR